MKKILIMLLCCVSGMLFAEKTYKMPECGEPGFDEFEYSVVINLTLRSTTDVPERKYNCSFMIKNTFRYKQEDFDYYGNWLEMGVFQMPKDSVFMCSYNLNMLSDFGTQYLAVDAMSDKDCKNIPMCLILPGRRKFIIEWNKASTEYRADSCYGVPNDTVEHLYSIYNGDTTDLVYKNDTIALTKISDAGKYLTDRLKFSILIKEKKDIPTGDKRATSPSEIRKIMKNGILYIYKNGNYYTLDGKLVDMGLCYAPSGNIIVNL